ncbi:type II toxin-antitoxin system RnlA family toxin [Clostridium perfringens]|uniref:type II toxin-antitoxin system RnlA family toxin n=1 Tax=Clostridium perfringens TaxID=1502 RepID=UPI0013E3DC23|nr:type II toxin-antitoxin system RnlA family toxin [Clostridium perfringens]MBO3395850.1 type II toxin-antitoxin system RnlA family toxin [Clostridium perfringens]MBO3402503.1 type II toxin-antitoxin system RnlA family toxin [Clostridium perfringens]MDU1476582.1 type II toxin-antitoxin system RnlA family toxin [Clostridium perfringens]MDU2827923.1 type II toxin-antitoxin system RnlA family toxin [Clostridium perfringens]MDU4419873.1 type II toxin-antitoxin system RnlA family toxin [Clostridiu
MSKEFKGLNLCREKIKESIERYLSIYFDEFTVSDMEEKGGSRKRFNIKISKGDFYIDFHFNSKGTTTIDDFGGAPEFVEIKKGIASFVKENCSINCSCNDSWFVVNDVDKENFELILEMLVESEYHLGDSIDYKKENEKGVICKLKGIYNDEVTITYYNTKKVVIQGKVLLLFNEAIAAFSELLELEDIPKCFNSLYKLNIDKDAVREKVKVLMQNSYDKFSNKLNKCIHQAVYYLFIDGDMFEYSAIPLTAFRALEGHIKYALKEFGIYTDKENKIFIGSHYKINKSTEKYELKCEVAAIINNESKVNNLEKAFNTYHDLRHIYSHWDDLLEGSNVDETAFIDNIGTAKTYIIDTLDIIDSYYTL